MTDQTPLTPKPRHGRKRVIIGGLAAAVVLGGGYGAYAVYDQLDGGGAQPHDVLPASTQAYVRVDLDPSAGQKVDLFRLIRKVPTLADEAGITSDKQDIRELVFRDLVASECDTLDYDKDVEPWLGDRIGVGANIEDESFLIAIQTTDESASRAGIKKLFTCADETYGIAFLDGYAIVGPQQSRRRHGRHGNVEGLPRRQEGVRRRLRGARQPGRRLRLGRPRGHRQEPHRQGCCRS